MPEQTVQLKVNRALYGGWKRLEAEVGIEQCSGAFSLEVTHTWPGQTQRMDIHAGDACELLLQGQTVISGFVDTRKPLLGVKRRGIRILGRDRTMDLIDCSAVYKSGQWKGVRVDRIARDIAQPFGIEVVAVGDMGDAFDSFNIEEGERAFEAIDRAARMRRLLVTTDGTGRLLLTRASKTHSGLRLAEDVNILDGSLDISWKERYSKVTVKGQGKGDAAVFGDRVAHGSATAEDVAINRYRPLVVLAEQHGQGSTFKQRAEWEVTVRRGRGTRASITVQGWLNEKGTLWKPNQLVSVDSPYLGIQEDLLIAKCTYSLDDTGTLTEMQLVHPAAFDVLQGVKTKRLAKDKARRDKKRGEVVDVETGKPIEQGMAR